MPRLSLVLSLLAMAWTRPVLGTARPGVSVAPASAWVLPLEPRLVGGGPSEVELPESLLADTQTRVTEGQAETYQRYANRIASRRDLESLANLELEFDPSYETITIHHVRILRGASVIDALVSQEVRLIQREQERAEQIYDGRLTAVLALHDVRVGDVVDYAYTKRGSNPVFGGRFLLRKRLGYGVQVERVRLRVLFPAARVLHHREVGLPAPRERALGQEREYVWDLQPAPAVHLETDLPGWFEPFPFVQLSEFESWGDVARWASALFEPTPRTRAAVARQVGAWKALASEEARFLAALRFVQDEVRFLGLGMGEYSHRPLAPEQVLERRFGDCKDKSALLVALLRELGIEAAPALVHTEATHDLIRQLPSPLAFDHALVRAVVAGNERWVDPTREQERGPVADLDPPRVGWALVVRPQTEALALVRVSASRALEEVEETYSFPSPGQLRVRVTDRWVGSAADSVRRHIAHDSLRSVERTIRQAYLNQFPFLEQATAMELADDEAQNVLAVTVTYLVPRSAAGDALEVEPHRIRRLLEPPVDEERELPLDITFPMHRKQTLRLELPGSAYVTPASTSISNSTFRFSRVVETEGNTVVLKYDFEARSGFVEAGAFQRYRQELEEARSQLRQRLSWQASRITTREASVVDERPLALALILLATTLVLGWQVMTAKRRSASR